MMQTGPRTLKCFLVTRLAMPPRLHRAPRPYSRAPSRRCGTSYPSHDGASSQVHRCRHPCPPAITFRGQGQPKRTARHGTMVLHLPQGTFQEDKPGLVRSPATRRRRGQGTFGEGESFWPELGRWHVGTKMADADVDFPVGRHSDAPRSVL